jgi:hypothetical protein
MITIKEKSLLDLLEECLPYLSFAVGGIDVDETLGKVRFVLKQAGRHVPQYRGNGSLPEEEEYDDQS